MTTFLGTDVKSEVQAILNDTTVWTDPKLTVNINAAIQAVFLDAPAARYTSPVALTDEVKLTLTGTSGTTMANTDAIAMDIRWKKAIVHYTAFLCFNQSDRNTANAAFATEQYKLYERAL